MTSYQDPSRNVGSLCGQDPDMQGHPQIVKPLKERMGGGPSDHIAW